MDLSLFEKLRITTIAGAHRLLDRPMKALTPEIIDQYVRELDQSIEQMHDELVLKQDDANQLARAISTAEARIVKLEGDIQALAPKNGAAPAADVQVRIRAMGAEAIKLKTALPAQREKLAEYQQAFAQMNAVVGQMEAKKHDMEDKRAEIASNQRTAASQNRAASAIEKGVAATQAGSGIDSLAEKTRRDGLVAEGRFQRAAGKIAGTADPVKEGELDAYIASLTNKGVNSAAAS